MPTVLIVEDEELVREVASAEFEDSGFTVLEAVDGDAALAHLAATAIDVLFTDIRLPGAIDGWEVARRARALFPGLPVIYATGFTGGELQIVPGGRFVGKPYLPVAIVTAALELVARAEPS